MANILITGITGQDGTCLAEHLLGKGHAVTGSCRRKSPSALWRLRERNLLEHPSLRVLECDPLDYDACVRLLEDAEPRIVFNLAAQSSVGRSFQDPLPTARSNAMGTLHLLEAIRILDPEIRFYQASSSEMYGSASAGYPHTENSLFHPQSPYAVSKLFGHWSAINYRESYDMYCCCGILFNHESPLRGKNFVTRKITSAVAEIHLGKRDVLALGNLNVSRDWGYAPDYVEAMAAMMILPSPEDFVIATGKAHTLRSFVELAFSAVGCRIIWRGSGLEEKGVDADTGRELVRVDPGFFRPSDVSCVLGNITKARDLLQWEPKTDFEDICRIMVETDLRRVGENFPY